MNPYFKTSPQQNFQAQIVSPAYYSRHLKNNYNLTKLFWGIEKEKMLPNLFCKFSKTLISKPSKDITTIKNYRLISLMNKDSLQENTSKSTYYN